MTGARVRPLWCFGLLLWTAAASYAATDERQITEATLRSYFAEVHAGDAIATERRPVRLSNTSIAPTADQLEVRVFSPANHEPSSRYRAARARLGKNLLRRSRRKVPIAVSLHDFALAVPDSTSCGPRLTSAYSDSVAVSRPGMSGDREEALIYLEFHGGARAYLLRRVAGSWIVQWHVELWACG